MERLLPEKKGGTDKDAEYNEGSYSNGTFSNNRWMPLEEEREEEEGRRTGGFGRGFIMPGVVPLPQGGDGAVVEGGHCVGEGG